MKNYPGPLNPIAFHFGPIEVHWYGIIIGLGAILGLYIATRESKKRGMSPDHITDLVMIALPIAIICARIYYVAFEWDYYKNHFSEIPQIWHGGIAIHGGLIGAIITAIILTKVRKIPFWKLADIAAPSILLGQAVGRWGNFMNQEAHGGPVSRTFLENLHLPAFIINQMDIDGVYYHPTFLYESVWSFIGVILLIMLRRVNLRRGEMFFSYLIWYSIGRFFIESMRTDSLMLNSHLRIAQIISIAIILVSILFIIVRRVNGCANERYMSTEV